jgi:hypothetical protein
MFGVIFVGNQQPGVKKVVEASNLGLQAKQSPQFGGYYEIAARLGAGPRADQPAARNAQAHRLLILVIQI